MAEKRFTLVIDEEGKILEITLPDGTKGEWLKLSQPLGDYPETVIATTIPFDILRTAVGRV
jgi:hypothetical protein